MSLTTPTQQAGASVVVTLIASVTFPNGIEVGNASSNSDFIAFDERTPCNNIINGINGGFAYASVRGETNLTLTVIAHSVSDKNLSLLYDNNSSIGSRSSVNDNITVIVNYVAAKEIHTFTDCVISDGSPGVGISSDATSPDRAYNFYYNEKKVESIS